RRPRAEQVAGVVLDAPPVADHEGLEQAASLRDVAPLVRLDVAGAVAMHRAQRAAGEVRAAHEPVAALAVVGVDGALLGVAVQVVAFGGGHAGLAEVPRRADPTPPASLFPSGEPSVLTDAGAGRSLAGWLRQRRLRGSRQGRSG
ncbi:MAG: hypothetical protein ACK56F_14345, partial [bacterium]